MMAKYRFSRSDATDPKITELFGFMTKSPTLTRRFQNEYRNKK